MHTISEASERIAALRLRRAEAARRRGRRFSALRTYRFWEIVFWRLAILAALLCAWQFLPELGAASSRVRWLNPFFISSPTRVYQQLSYMTTGSHNAPLLWTYLWNTIEATLIGTTTGLLIGAVAGAFLSNNARLSDILSIYITVLNATPRIALIPIIIIIVGTGIEASVVACILVVSFLAFFNAFEGGRSVPKPVLQNAQVLKASRWQVMFRIRFPYVLMWVFAALPNAVAFGLLSVVTAELLTGNYGMGGLILIATTNVNSTLSFSVIVVLCTVGVALVALGERIKRIVLHWTY